MAPRDRSWNMDRDLIRDPGLFHTPFPKSLWNNAT